MVSKKIMIVEDDLSILEILCWLLAEQGYQTISLTTSMELESFPGELPDLVLVDLRLLGSEKNGAEICHLLKSQPTTKDIPVIILSAELDIALVSRTCGADDYIEKPFNVENLLMKIEAHL